MAGLTQIYRDLAAAIGDGRSQQSVLATTDYRLGDLETAARELAGLGFDTQFNQDRTSLSVTDPATHFYVAERLDDQDELTPADVHVLNHGAQKVLITKRNGIYTLHFHLNAAQRRQTIRLTPESHAELIALLNAAPMGMAPQNSPLAQKMTMTVREAMGKIDTPEDVVLGKAFPVSLRALVTIYRSQAAGTAATMATAAPAAQTGPFDVGFDLARLQGITNRDVAFAALLACLKEVGGSTTIDSQKRMQVIQRLLSLNAQGEYASQTFPIGPAGNIAITANTWVKSLTNAPQSHDVLGQLPSDLRVVVFERTKPKANGEWQ